MVKVHAHAALFLKLHLLRSTLLAGRKIYDGAHFFGSPLLGEEAKGELPGVRMNEAAIIRQLKIDRFRGIENLEWNPAPGMNIILGGGDVGKTTIL